MYKKEKRPHRKRSDCYRVGDDVEVAVELDGEEDEAGVVVDEKGAEENGITVTSRTK